MMLKWILWLVCSHMACRNTQADSTVLLWTKSYLLTDETTVAGFTSGDWVETKDASLFAATSSAQLAGYYILKHENQLPFAGYGFSNWWDWWKWENHNQRGQAGYKSGNSVTGNPPLFDPGSFPSTDVAIVANGEHADGNRQWYDGHFKSRMNIRETQTMLSQSGAIHPTQAVKLVLSIWPKEWSTVAYDYGTASAPIPYSSVTVAGQQVNCNGEVYVELGNTVVDITPVVATPYEWYTYTFTATPVVQMTMFLQRHPNFTSVPPNPSHLKYFFNPPDSDGCIEDTNPILAGPTYYSDRVPVGMEARIAYLGIQTFSAQFSDTIYFEIKDDTALNYLKDNLLFPEIKLVKSIKRTNGDILGGWSNVGNPRSCVIAAGESDDVWRHEIAHAGGLQHRGMPVSNPGSDVNALMKEIKPIGPELNRWERGILTGGL